MLQLYTDLSGLGRLAVEQDILNTLVVWNMSRLNATNRCVNNNIQASGHLRSEFPITKVLLQYFQISPVLRLMYCQVWNGLKWNTTTSTCTIMHHVTTCKFSNQFCFSSVFLLNTAEYNITLVYLPSTTSTAWFTGPGFSLFPVSAALASWASIFW